MVSLRSARATLAFSLCAAACSSAKSGPGKADVLAFADAAPDAATVELDGAMPVDAAPDAEATQDAGEMDQGVAVDAESDGGSTDGASTDAEGTDLASGGDAQIGDAPPSDAEDAASSDAATSSDAGATRGCIGDGWCWARPIIGLDILSGLWARTASDAWVVGVAGTTAHFDGVRWSLVDSPTNVDLYAVHGRAVDDVWAVGNRGTVIRFDGTAWTLVPTSTGSDLRAVVTTTTDVWIGGRSRTILRRNGSGWSSSGTVARDVASFWASGPNDVWSVASDNVDVFRWDGARWNRRIVSDYGVFGAVSGTGPDDVWAVGGGGAVTHWDGVGWTDVFVPYVIDGVDAIFAAGPNDLHAVATYSGCGFYGGGECYFARYRVVLHYDGQRWTAVPGLDASLGHAIYGSSASDIWLAGDHGSIHHFDAHGWDPGYATNAVFAAGADDVWKVGGSIEHWDGLSWTTAAASIPAQHYLIAAHGSGPSDVYAVGNSGIVLHYDGSSWSSAIVGSDHLYAVFAPDIDETWVAGANGTVYHRTGPTWMLSSTGTTANLLGLWGSARDDLWISGERGLLLHGNGLAWTVVQSGTRDTLRALWGGGMNDVYAVGGDQLAVSLHWDGTGWFPTSVPFGEPMTGIWGASGTDFYITGAFGTLGRWNGRIWTHALDGTDMPLRAVSGAGGQAWAVGTWAALLHR
jgi:hypothetical protein